MLPNLGHTIGYITYSHKLSFSLGQDIWIWSNCIIFDETGNLSPNWVDMLLLNILFLLHAKGLWFDLISILTVRCRTAMLESTGPVKNEGEHGQRYCVAFPDEQAHF